jgi:hypothetical protein
MGCVSGDVFEYAKYIGIDPDKDASLLWIAAEGISAPVPGLLFRTFQLTGCF